MAKEIDLVSKDYTELNVIAGTALVAGQISLVGGAVGFPLADVVNGAVFSMIVESRKVRAAKKAEAIVGGAPLYWNDTNSNVQTTLIAGTLLGYAAEAAAAGDATIAMSFDGKGAVLS